MSVPDSSVLPETRRVEPARGRERSDPTEHARGSEATEHPFHTLRRAVFVRDASGHTVLVPTPMEERETPGACHDTFICPCGKTLLNVAEDLTSSQTTEYVMRCLTAKPAAFLDERTTTS